MPKWSELTEEEKKIAYKRLKEANTALEKKLKDADKKCENEVKKAFKKASEIAYKKGYENAAKIAFSMSRGTTKIPKYRKNSSKPKTASVSASACEPTICMDSDDEDEVDATGAEATTGSTPPSLPESE